MDFFLVWDLLGKTHSCFSLSFHQFLLGSFYLFAGTDLNETPPVKSVTADTTCLFDFGRM